jgi:hypothetical protein
VNAGVHRRNWKEAAFVAAVGWLCLGTVIAEAQVLPDSPKNRQMGVVGCIQNRQTGTIDCSNKFGGSGGGASTPGMGSFNGPGFQLGLQLGCIIFNNCQSAGHDPAAAEQQRQMELERQRQAIQEELDRQRARQQEFERKAKEDWERDKQQAYGMLKGPKPSGTLGLKGAVDPSEAGLKSIGSAQANNFSKQTKRLQCSAYLANKARAAAEAGQKEEAAYLDEQAALAMSGGTLSVKCPEMPDIPMPVGTAVGKPSAEAQQAKLHMELLQSVKGHLDQLASTHHEIKAWQTKKEEATKQVQKREQEVARATQTASATPAGTPPEHSVEDEAQRLLDEAKQLEREAIKGLEDATQRQQHIVEQIKEKSSQYDKMQSGLQETDRQLPQAQKN